MDDVVGWTTNGVDDDVGWTTDGVEGRKSPSNTDDGGCRIAAAVGWTTKGCCTDLVVEVK